MGFDAAMGLGDWVIAMGEKKSLLLPGKDRLELHTANVY
jgi:hypothetical protein